MKKLFISIGIIMLAGISAVVLFYPDYSSNVNEDYFTGTIILEIVNNDGSKIDDYNDNALAKEAMQNTIEKIDKGFLSITLKDIGYDNKLNLIEATDTINLFNDKQYLLIKITSFDGQYVEKMITQLEVKLTESSGSQPYFKLLVYEPKHIERTPTVSAFFSRRIGEEITVAIFVIIWISILGFILKQEIIQDVSNENEK